MVMVDMVDVVVCMVQVLRALQEGKYYTEEAEIGQIAFGI